jgi:N-terminal acetyltransferase B complex non-catalytic subunit
LVFAFILHFLKQATTADQAGASERDYLVEAAAILEEHAERSPAFFQFKILLTRIYCLLGAVVPALDVFTELDIKHLLIDTVSHLVALLFLPLAHPKSADHFKTMLSFYGSQSNDVSVFDCNSLGTYLF